MQPLTVAKRAPKRSRLFLAAEVHDGNVSSIAHIRDISSSGALVESDNAPQAGTSVRLTCGGTVVDARVAWADDKCFGLEFSTPLLAGDLVDATGARLKLSAPRTYRSGDIID